MAHMCSSCNASITAIQALAGTCPRCGSTIAAATATDVAAVQETVDLPTVGTVAITGDEATERFHMEIRRHLVAREGEGDPSAEYEIIDRIGEGGMGEVYSARQTSIGRVIAIKMVRPRFIGDPAVRDKFMGEVAVTSDLDHPNIVPIHEIGATADGQLFYTMKRVRGTPWSTVMRERGRDHNLDILLRVCDAVAFAHFRGVIHRDLKPDNVMIGDYGEVFVMDWGMAVSVTDTGRAEPVSSVRTIAGTPAYMAPEMAAGQFDRLGLHSDIYLLGAILYEIITGDCPHAGSTLDESLESARSNAVKRPATGGELAEIALRAMSTDPEKRYPSVRAFQEAIRNYQSHAHSLFLASRALDDFRTARKTRSYEQFNQALFGFREALVLWDGNGFARDQIQEVSLAYAECAYQKNDYDLAQSLLSTDSLRATELSTAVEKARRDRERRDRRFYLFKMGMITLACLVLFVILVSSLALQQEKEKRQIVQQHAREQQERAQRAEQEQKEMQQQRQDVWLPVADYDFATLAAGAVDFRCVTFDTRTPEPSMTPATDMAVIEGGALRLKPAEDRYRLQLVWNKPVPEEIRLEATVLNDSPEGPNLDLNISGDAISGYRLRVFGYNHIQFETESGRTWERLYRCPIELDPNAPGYVFALWRTNNTFVAAVNGMEVMRLDDPLALRGRSHRTFSVGRYGREGSSSITRLQIARRQDPQYVSVLEPGKVLLHKGYLRDAREWFERIDAERTEPEVRGEARYLLSTIAKTAPEKIQQLQAIAEDTTNPFRTHALRDLSYIQYGENALDKAVDALLLLKSIKADDPTPQHFFGIVRPRIAEAEGAAKLELCAQLGRLPLTMLEIDGLEIPTFAPFSRMQSLVFLDCSSNPLGSLSMLRDLRSLRILYCRQTGITSLEPLAGLPIEVLDCSNNEITDLTPLAGMQLRKLVFSAEHVEQGWDVIRGMPTLQYLDGMGNRNTKQTPETFWKSLTQNGAAVTGETSPATPAASAPAAPATPVIMSAPPTGMSPEIPAAPVPEALQDNGTPKAPAPEQPAPAGGGTPATTTTPAPTGTAASVPAGARQ